MSLSELTTPARRMAIVGLAKNTGKTETLGAIVLRLGELQRTVGVTSIGRDGEEHDAIDERIAKPSVRLRAGSLVATTDALLRAADAPHELLHDTGLRTPLGRVLVARLHAPARIEVAGPSAAQDVRAVADAMLAAGADQVLIDGAIDRRAASSPAVCDGLVIATGAVLDEQIEQVVAKTVDAVELALLPQTEHELVRRLAVTGEGSLLVDAETAETYALPPRFLLTATAGEIASLLRAHPRASHLVVHGALCEPFLHELLAAARARSLELVVADSAKVFLAGRPCRWYEAQGLAIRVATPVRLCAITVNPLAPRSHSFDPQRLRSLLAAAIPGVPVLDVRDPAHGLVAAGAGA